MITNLTFYPLLYIYLPRCILRDAGDWRWLQLLLKTGSLSSLFSNVEKDIIVQAMTHYLIKQCESGDVNESSNILNDTCMPMGVSTLQSSNVDKKTSMDSQQHKGFSIIWGIAGNINTDYILLWILSDLFVVFLTRCLKNIHVVLLSSFFLASSGLKTAKDPFSYKVY